MSNEIGVGFGTTGVSLYSQIFNRLSGYIYNVLSGQFENYASLSGNLNSYAVPLSELGGASKMYRGNMPGPIPAGTYDIRALQRINAFYAETDPTVAVGELAWAQSGGPYRSITDLMTSGSIAGFLPLRITKGVAVSGFSFKLVSSADHITPLTSGATSVSGQISQNSNAFTSLQSGTLLAGYKEIGAGWYACSLTSGDLNCDVAALNFKAAGSDPRDILILTQP